MAQISTFIDRKLALGAGEVKTANIDTDAVTRNEIAPRAVGTTEHGTLDLSRAIGTLNTADVGTILGASGSFATLSGRLVRMEEGSYRGTVSSPLTRGDVGSFGSVAHGVSRGERWEWRTSEGTMEARLTSPGTWTLQTPEGTALAVNVHNRTVPVLGSVTAPRAADKIRTGTLSTPRHQLLQNLGGSLDLGSPAGQVQGTLTNRHIPVLTDLQGSLDLNTKTLGSLSILNRTRGTLSASRVQPLSQRGQSLEREVFSQISLEGLAVGSFFSDLGNPLGVGVGPRGDVWYAVDASDPDDYIHRLGTVALRGGTNTRMGTVHIGSVKAPNQSQPRAVGVGPNGKVWVTESGVEYTSLLGTLPLRGGTGSRLGTTQIGSFRSPGDSFHGVGVSPRGEVWGQDGAVNYVFRLGTLALRNGTDSRLGTTQIGSFLGPGPSTQGVGVDGQGIVWTSDNNVNRVFRLGTLALRGGTDSRLGTVQFGSFPSPNSSPAGLGFGPHAHLWHSDQNTDYLYRLDPFRLTPLAQDVRSGTFNAPRIPNRVGTFRGAGGDRTVDNDLRPPKRSRDVAIAINLDPGVDTDDVADLTQDRVGTISRVNAPGGLAGDQAMMMGGVIEAGSPGDAGRPGSYRVRTSGQGQGSIVIWTEWQRD